MRSGTTTLSLQTGIMELVPAGGLRMGTDDEDPDAGANERPSHPVFTAAFYMDRTLVTNAQFQRFCRETGYRTTAERLGEGDVYHDGRWEWVKGASWRHPLGSGTDLSGRMDHPVVLVTVGDAFAYCSWRARLEGRPFRLPTEAEWERAARGGTASRYPWGDGPVDEDGVLRARFNDGVAEGTAPVGSYPAGRSPHGILDLAGNAWDWCLDAYDEAYYRRAPPVDAGGPLSLSTESVFRGGSWVFPRTALRATARHSNQMMRPSAGISFRTVSPLHADSLVLRSRIVCRRAACQVGYWRRRLRGRDDA